MRTPIRRRRSSPRSGVALFLAVFLCLMAGGVCVSLIQMMSLWSRTVETAHRRRQSELLAEAGLLLARDIPPAADGSPVSREWSPPFEPSLRLTGRVTVGIEPSADGRSRSATVIAEVGDLPPRRCVTRLHDLIPNRQEEQLP